MVNSFLFEQNTLEQVQDYDKVVNKLRDFYRSKGLIETFTQGILNPLSACENPKSISEFLYVSTEKEESGAVTTEKRVQALPQTGQMQLELRLLQNPGVKGFYCFTTSYRSEPNPIPGRHLRIFPMSEFELAGDFADMQQFEREMLDFLGYGDSLSYPEIEYTDAQKKFNVDELQAEHEETLHQELGSAYCIKNFPEEFAFFNMKRFTSAEGKVLTKKQDVCLHGMETIGSAERSTDKDQIRESFYTISNGEYSGLLFEKFGKFRVEQALEEFLSFDMIPRFGGGIGLSRLIRSMKLQGLV